MFLELTDKVAVVTGGAQGMGYAVAERLSYAGASVVIVSRNEEKVSSAAALLLDKGSKALAIRADVTQPTEVDSIFESTMGEFGGLGILVNNAGMTGRDAPLWELTDEDWDSVLDVDLNGTFYCCRAVIRHMSERRGGCDR